MDRPELVDHCLELFVPLGTPRARRMFGGYGFYIDDVFIAIAAGRRLYLKTDAQTRPAFEAAGCEPFIYDSERGAVALGYWSAPEDALESPQDMQPWARLAFEAALRARAAKLGRKAAPKAPRRRSAIRTPSR